MKKVHSWVQTVRQRPAYESVYAYQVFFTHDRAVKHIRLLWMTEVRGRWQSDQLSIAVRISTAQLNTQAHTVRRHLAIQTAGWTDGILASERSTNEIRRRQTPQLIIGPIVGSLQQQ